MEGAPLTKDGEPPLTKDGEPPLLSRLKSPHLLRLEGTPLTKAGEPPSYQVASRYALPGREWLAWLCPHPYYNWSQLWGRFLSQQNPVAPADQKGQS